MQKPKEVYVGGTTYTLFNVDNNIYINKDGGFIQEKSPGEWKIVYDDARLERED